MQVLELIVVEGKNDTARLKQAIQAETIETNGLNISAGFLDYLTHIQATRGLIIFTDPDHAGELIRRKINQAIPGCKNAFVYYKTARNLAKVGVEYASPEEIQLALAHLVTYHDDIIETLEMKDLMSLKLIGPNSNLLRQKVAEYFHIGSISAKTFLKRLNYLQISYPELAQITERFYE